MAAPLGFKDFTTGEVLTAADVDGYLMQGIWVFANATARDAAVTSPQEGNSCYLKDTDVIQVYSGSSWVVKSGGSSPLTTKGDLYTYSTTDTRLASSGVNNDVLTVDTSTATGLKWAAPASSGGMTLITTTTFNNTASTYTYSSLGSYKHLLIVGQGLQGSDGVVDSIGFQVNSDTGSNYYTGFIQSQAGTVSGQNQTASNFLLRWALADTAAASASFAATSLWIWDYAGSGYKQNTAIVATGSGGNRFVTSNGNWNNTAAITSLTFFTTSGNNFKAGIFKLYGVS